MIMPATNKSESHSAGMDRLWTLELGGWPGGKNFFLRRRQKALALGLFAGGLARPADGLGFFTNTLFGRLLVRAPCLHFAEDAFTLHLLLQYPHGLFDIVVAYEYLQFFS
jgi:hypothetical protein